MGPHGPYGAPTIFLPGDPPPVRLADHPRNKGGGYPVAAPGDSVSAHELEVIRHVYAADVRYVDEAVGLVLDALRREGRIDETIVVFVADHGEEFYDHKGWNHGGSVFDEIVRVPFVASGAPIGARGAVVDEPARLVDVFPTVLDWVGLESPPNLPGRSLRALMAAGADSLSSASDSARVPVFVEGCVHHPPGFETDAIIGGDYKLIQIRHNRLETRLLFDLEADPAELTNLADSLPTLRDSLTRELLAWKQATALAAGARRGARLDPETEARLRALGYIQ